MKKKPSLYVQVLRIWTTNNLIRPQHGGDTWSYNLLGIGVICRGNDITVLQYEKGLLSAFLRQCALPTKRDVSRHLHQHHPRANLPSHVLSLMREK